MAPDSPSASTETTASLLRASGLADLSHAADLARALLAMECLKTEIEILRAELQEERALRARAHADLLSLISIVSAYPLNTKLEPDDWQQVKAISARWTEGG